MANQTRLKGQWMKKKVLEKRIKAMTAIVKGRNQNLKVSETEEYTEGNLCVGRRIVELSELGKNLICCNCKQVLSLNNIESEKRLGFNSILNVRCGNCLVLTEVATGKMHSKRSDTNTKAVLGTLSFISKPDTC